MSNLSSINRNFRLTANLSVVSVIYRFGMCASVGIPNVAAVRGRTLQHRRCKGAAHPGKPWVTQKNS
jgi:hypothetical protein